jgi:hypothetical protein
MASLKAGKWTYTEAELDRMFKEADQRGKERMKTEPRAARATYDAASRRLVIELLNGCVFIVPVDLMQGLRGASDKDLADFQLMPRGFDLHWKKLDAQFTVAGLLAGRFGTKKWMAELERSASRSTSKAKRAAARANSTKRGQSRPSPAAKTTKRPRSTGY